MWNILVVIVLQDLCTRMAELYLRQTCDFTMHSSKNIFKTDYFNEFEISWSELLDHLQTSADG